MAVARQGSLPPLPLGNQAISRVRTSKSDAESVLNERGDDLSPLEMNESGRSTPFRIRRVGEDDRSKLPSSFPRMPPYGNAADQPSHKVASSLLLQQLLYYNTFYSLGWLAASFGHRNYQHHGNDDIWYVFASFWIFCEPIRLTFGWTGNLRESVPNLFIFILLTVIPQIPAQIYLAAFQKDITSFDKALGTVSVVFLLLEAITGPVALLRLLYAQAERYYLEEKQAEKELEKSQFRRT